MIDSDRGPRSMIVAAVIIFAITVGLVGLSLYRACTAAVAPTQQRNVNV